MNPDPTIRPASAPSGEERAVDSFRREPATVLLEYLHSTEPRTRVAAARALGKRHEGSEPVVERLTDGLADKDPFARRAVAVALGKIGSAAKSATPALLSAMQDGYENVNDMTGREASHALLKIDLEGAVWLPILRSQLTDENAERRTRRRAAYLLREMGDAAKSAVAALSSVTC